MNARQTVATALMARALRDEFGDPEKTWETTSRAERGFWWQDAQRVLARASDDRKWKACPSRTCEMGQTLEQFHFVPCPVCKGEAIVERKPGFFDAMRWTDLAYPALCVLVMVAAWVVLT